MYKITSIITNGNGLTREYTPYKKVKRTKVDKAFERVIMDSVAIISDDFSKPYSMFVLNEMGIVIGHSDSTAFMVKKELR